MNSYILTAVILSMAAIHDANAFWYESDDRDDSYGRKDSDRYGRYGRKDSDSDCPDPDEAERQSRKRLMVNKENCVSDRTCNGHGYCPPVNLTDDCRKCRCTGNYTGIFCTVPPDCTPNGGQCGRNGNCDVTTLKCICTNKYKGRFCRIAPFCTPTGNECGPFGECDVCSHPTINFCRCNSGYGGENCTEAPACTDGGNECNNGGTCNFKKTPFVCDCPCGFTKMGPTCGGQHVTCFLWLLLLSLLGGSMISPR